MKILKKIGLVLLVVFVIAQFFGPEKNEGDVASLQTFISETNPSDDVHKILKKACFDCHSNTTRYPWYSNITPVNFWMADHVKHGKGDLNFSEWSKYSLKKKEHKMEEEEDDFYDEADKGAYEDEGIDASLDSESEEENHSEDEEDLDEMEEEEEGDDLNENSEEDSNDSVKSILP